MGTHMVRDDPEHSTHPADTHAVINVEGARENNLRDVTVSGSGSITIERGPGKARRTAAAYTRIGGMCPRCEGTGAVSDAT